MKRFREVVYDYYARHGRDLPWRRTRDPYRILVSEVMLQQTQVSRALEKYPLFIRRFPTVRSLAQAPLGDIVRVWSGMGYNRRALFLKKIAQKIVSEYGGVIPRGRDALASLPGIGETTAGAIRAFAFNEAGAFIETNIRSVFIHHFFRRRKKVSDKELMPLVARSCDTKYPRRWYSALMDYGVYLKGKVPNPSRKSRHHTRQGRFEGSDRQIRGAILKAVAEGRVSSVPDVYSLVNAGRGRVDGIVRRLEREGLIKRRGIFLSI